MTIRQALLRLLICGVLACAVWRGAAAQGNATPEIGFLAPGPRAAMESFAAAFRRGLAGQGYIDGENIRVMWHWQDEPGDAATELAKAPLRLVVAPSLQAVETVRRTNPAIPIVTIVLDDPVASKLAASLSRPGGLVTGLTGYRADFPTRRLRLLHEASPLITRVAYLGDPAAPSTAQTEAAARGLNLALQVIALRTPGDLEPALAQLASAPVGALLVSPDPVAYAERARIATAAAARRLPVMFGASDFMDVDGLMSLGGDLERLYVQAARYAADILHGAKPGDLPILGPSPVELVINLRNAHALGLNLPPALLAKADRLIE